MQRMLCCFSFNLHALGKGSTVHLLQVDLWVLVGLEGLDFRQVPWGRLLRVLRVCRAGLGLRGFLGFRACLVVQVRPFRRDHLVCL